MSAAEAAAAAPAPRTETRSTAQALLVLAAAQQRQATPDDTPSFVPGTFTPPEQTWDASPCA